MSYMRTQVVSWRLTKDLKSALEEDARKRGLTVSAVLDSAVHKWLETSQAEERRQSQRAQSQAAPFVGAINDDTWSSTKVRQTVRDRIKRRHGR